MNVVGDKIEKIRLTPLGNGDVRAEILGISGNSSSFTGNRETIRKILAQHFSDVPLEDESGLLSGLPQSCENDWQQDVAAD